MFCSKCGKELEEGQSYCTSCNYQLHNTQSATNEQFSQSDKKQQSSGFFSQEDFDNMSQQQSKGKGSVLPTIFGVLGIICCIINYLGVPVFHLLGLALGISAVVKGTSEKKLNYSNTTMGIVLGWIAIGLGLFALVYGIAYSAM